MINYDPQNGSTVRDTIVVSFFGRNLEVLKPYFKALEFLKLEHPELKVFIDNYANPIEHPAGRLEWFKASKRAVAFVEFVSMESIQSPNCSAELNEMLDIAFIDGVPIIFVLVEELPGWSKFMNLTFARLPNTHLAVLSNIKESSEIHGMALHLADIVHKQIRNPRFVPILSKSVEEVSEFLGIYPRMKDKLGQIRQYAEYLCHFWDERQTLLHRSDWAPSKIMDEVFTLAAGSQKPILDARVVTEFAPITPISIISDDVQSKLLDGAVEQLTAMPGGAFPCNLGLLAQSVRIVEIVPRRLAADGQLKPLNDGTFKVFLNELDSDLKRNFTLAHEIMHAFLLLANPELNQHAPWVETLCNNGAAELLMPKEVFLRYLESNKVSPRTLREASGYFEVSIKAIAVRADRFASVSTCKIHRGIKDWSKGRLFDRFNEQDWQVLMDTVSNGMTGRAKLFFEGPRCPMEIMWERLDSERINVIGWAKLLPKYRETTWTIDNNLL